MKAYTDISQGKTLSKILPIESADSYYSWHDEQYYIVNKDCPYPYSLKEKILCWSLAALLKVLPYKIKLSHDVIDVNGNPAYKNECCKFSINRYGLFGDKWNVQYYGKHQRQLGKRYKELYIDLLFSENYDNLVDACYEMILKLHELKIL